MFLVSGVWEKLCMFTIQDGVNASQTVNKEFHLYIFTYCIIHTSIFTIYVLAEYIVYIRNLDLGGEWDRNDNFLYWQVGDFLCLMN